MNSPRSLEACRQLGINPESLYYVKFKTFVRTHPEIIRLNEELQKKRFNNINKYREEMIASVIQKREEIIKEQEKEETAETNIDNSKSAKKKKKLDVLNLEKMLVDMKRREERNIEKIKQKQKNEIFSEIERNIKNKIIINKSNLKEQKVEILHAYIKHKMMEKAQKEDEMQKKCEEKRDRLLKEKIERFEKDNNIKHEGELRQLEKNQQDNLKMQREKEKNQKLMSEEYEKRLQQSRERVRENRQKIIDGIEKKRQYTQQLYNKLMEEREAKIRKQKSLNLQKMQHMKEVLKIKKKYVSSAKVQKLHKEKEIKQRSQSQSELFAQNQEKKEQMREALIEKYNQLEKEMKQKEEKMEKERKKKLYDISMKQEDDYLKLYEKKQNIDKIERINQYKGEKRKEEMRRKEQKMEEFKKMKNELIQSKSKQADKFEKEKEKLIVDFERNFRNKEHFDTNQLIQNLFPTQDLSENDTKLKVKIEQLIEQMNKTDPKNLDKNFLITNLQNETSKDN